MSTVAAATLKPGDVLAGRPITAVYRAGRRVVVAPHGWSYHELDSIVLGGQP